MTDGEAEAQSLCLACGLCCDGTLFQRTTISPEHDGAVLDLELFKDVRDQPALPQPCPALEAGGCTVYGCRPRACRGYRCELLKRFERSEVSYDEARRLIDKHRGDFDRATSALAAAERDDSLAASEKRAAEFARFVALYSIKKIFQGKNMLR